MTFATAPGICPTAGSGHLLNLLVTEHAGPLLAYTERLMRDRHSAEDIVQETLIRAWQHTDRLHGSHGSVRGWLLTVARNLAIDRIRSARSRHEWVGTQDYDIVQVDHADAVLAKIDALTLLGQLSPEHREVLEHTYLCGRTIQETAHVLGIPTGTVKSRQHYALSSLRSRIRYQTRGDVTTAPRAVVHSGRHGEP